MNLLVKEFNERSKAKTKPDGVDFYIKEYQRSSILKLSQGDIFSALFQKLDELFCFFEKTNVLVTEQIYLLLLVDSKEGQRFHRGLYHYRPDILSFELVTKQVPTNYHTFFSEKTDEISGIFFITSILSALPTLSEERFYKNALILSGVFAGAILTSLDADKKNKVVHFSDFNDSEVESFLDIDGISETVNSVIPFKLR